MRRTIVDNPKDSFRRAIRLLLHHIVHQAIKRYNLNRCEFVMLSGDKVDL